MKIAWKWILIGALLAAAAIWPWAVAPQLLKLPPNYSYAADIISTDNFYDEEKGDFIGPQRSVTKFSYEIVDKQQGNLIVKNVFDVRKITGEKIFAVERLYGIDRKTGKHIAGFGDKNRDGYLFAPKNLEKGQPFTYWHINYDGPATMIFAGEEEINGLRVYRYETRYEGVKIDQTANLGSLPGVGKTRGVELEPYLQLWIEPVSGHLVKYKDDTVAYYYDLKTGVRQNPWNHFSNSYTLESVLHQVEIAKQEKLNFIVIDFAVPVLLALAAVIVLTFCYRKNKAVAFLSLGLVAVALVVGIGMWLVPKFSAYPAYTGSVEKIRIGVELGLLPAPVRIAEHNGYFKEQGIDLAITDFSSGRAALSAMLTEGNLDMATVAQTPIVLNSFDRNDYQIIAGMVSSSNDVKILARKDRNINTPADLKGKKVGMTRGSTGHYFLSLFLAQHSLSLDDIVTVDIAATALPEAINEGTVDAIATWEPNLYRASQLLGDNALILESRGTYREDFYFAVFKDWAKSNPELLERFLRAIDSAETFIAEHSKESQEIVAERLQIDPLFIASVWDDFSYGLFLDQAILLTFEQQARWMIANKLTDKSTLPNYLDFIYFDALEAVKPEAVTIIH